MSSSSSSTHNMAFMSSSNNNTRSTNRAVNTAHRVSTASTQFNDAYSTNIDNLSDAVIYSLFGSQPNSPLLVHEDLEQIYQDNMEEMDLRWQMALLTVRARMFLKKTGRKLTINALVSSDGLGGYDWSDQAKEGPNYALMAFSSSNSYSEVSNDSTCSKSCLEIVKLLKSKDLMKFDLMVLGNFMPPIPDLSFIGLDEFVHKHVVKNCRVMSSKEEPKVVRKNDDAPIVEEWVSQPKYEKKTVRPSIVKKEFVKSKQQEKTARKTVKQIEHHRQNTHSPRGNQRN
nr:hypothetical protein [Tanacetum cinerariifolium]